MKQIKKIFLTLALATASVSAFAIDFDFGARAGMNINNISGTKGFDKNLFHAGAYVGAIVGMEIPGVPMLAVRVEPMFSMQGASRFNEIPIVKTEVTSNFNYNYINLPILAEVKLLNDKLSILAGPQIGFAVGANATVKSGDDKTNTKLDADDYNVFDAGLTFGASYMITRNIGVDLRYNLGLTNMSTAKDPNWQNRVFSIGVCFVL